MRQAKRHCPDVEFSPEDASRTEPQFLAEVVTAVIEAGATTVNIPDTVGYAMPEHFSELIRYLRKHVPNIQAATISVHCHNDLGLAVANSLAAVQAGADQVECTINGLGERAGNAALEEIVMAIKTRRDLFQAVTAIATRRLLATSRMVSTLTGMQVQRNKAIVGDNAFAHEAGIHQHGMMQHRSTYEIMHAEDVGRSSELTWGKHMGHHAVGKKLEEMGYKLSEDEIRRVTDQIKALADKKKAVYDDDVRALVEGQFIEVPQVWKLDHLTVITGKTPTATVTLTHAGKKEPITNAGTGDGPIDAMLKTIDRITGLKGSLVDYSVKSVTRGKDAIGEVSVRVKFNGDAVRIVTGKAGSTDIIEASALAYLNALHRYLDEQRRRAEGEKPTL